MRHDDGIEVSLVRGDKYYPERKVSQNRAEQLIRDKKGNQYEDDRLLATYASIHRQLDDASDETVKVAVRFDARHFKMFAGEVLRFKICVGAPNATYTHHVTEHTEGFVYELISISGSNVPADRGRSLPCSKARSVLPAGVWTRGFKAAPGTLVVFITRGKFATDRKSQRIDVGFTPTQSKNGHDYVFQFQCLPKNSPLAPAPIRETSKAVAPPNRKTIQPSVAPLAVAANLTPAPTPKVHALAHAPRSTGLPSHSIPRLATADPASQQDGSAKQTTIAYAATKRKASADTSTTEPTLDDNSSMAKKQKRASQDVSAGEQASDDVLSVLETVSVVPQAGGQAHDQSRPCRFPPGRNAGKQPMELVDLTMDDSADEKEVPLKQEVGLAVDKEEDSDEEDVKLALLAVQLQIKLKAKQKKAQKAKVGAENIKIEHD